MLPIVAIPTEIAEAVRVPSLRLFMIPRSRRGGHQRSPCRHCLCAFVAAKTAEFSLPMIASRESSRFLSPPGLCSRGSCERYSEHAGFPEELRGPAHCRGYAHGRRLVPRNTGGWGIRAGHRKTARPSQRRHLQVKQHHRWLFHLPH